MTYWWDDDDCYYGSTVVCGDPSIVSFSGCLEGPGNSEAFYAELRELGEVTRADTRFQDLITKFRERMLDYGDGRITDVATAMTWQAIFYQFFGIAFCEDPSCRLYNAHWQEEMLRAVLPGGGKLCEVHVKRLTLTGEDDVSVRM
jgi:hypothetical protein